MARGRMISKAISLDEKVHLLSDDTARLLFTWLIPHLDCEGRMHGDAQTVKSIVFPRRSISVKKVEKYLKEMEKNGLILRYCVNEITFLCAPRFEKHQTGLQKHKEAQSQIPPIPLDLLRSYSGVSHLQVEGEGEGEEEVKDTTTPPPVPTEDVAAAAAFNEGENNIYKLYMDNIGFIAPILVDELKDAENKYPLDWVEDAFKEAIKHNARNWKYVISILGRWEREGRNHDKAPTSKNTTVYLQDTED